jgi:hypothetical protein
LGQKVKGDGIYRSDRQAYLTAGIRFSPTSLSDYCKFGKDGRINKKSLSEETILLDFTFFI